ncbi:HAD superfamily subfamily IIIB acid phosphatase [Euphorbia peplus]|nr:HAD superfamily subfamily IIIB acid phosphatase [Euphorbia peplus]
MAPSKFHWLLSVVVLLSFIQIAISESVVLEMPNHHHLHRGRPHNFLYCNSWRLSVETNNAGPWETIASNCTSFVDQYMTGVRLLSDSNVVVHNSHAFAQTVNLTGHGNDVWVFDIDDTLLSTYALQQARGFGSEPVEALSMEASSNIDLFDLPALPASLKLYNKLLDMNFTPVLLTGRAEFLRNGTEENLLKVGYTNWNRLILRGDGDKDKKAVDYKSEKRQELIDEGYIIHGSSGDQWSDLLGYAVAERSFKVPNPMYYIA